MPNFFQKLESKNLIYTGVIIIPNIIEYTQYERLYEHQGTIRHPRLKDSSQYWNKFKKDYNINYNFLDNITDFEQEKNEIICLWFFPERLYKEDKRIGFFDLKINNKDIKYDTNTVLITNKRIDILENKFVLRRPCVQIDIQSIDITTKKKIKQMFKRDLG